MLQAAQSQGFLVKGAERCAVVAGGVGVFTCDAQDVVGGWSESVEDEGAKGVGDPVLAVEVLAHVARKDAVPVGVVHDVVIVLGAGAVCGPGDGGTCVRDVANFDVHCGPETRKKEMLNVLDLCQSLLNWTLSTASDKL